MKRTLSFLLASAFIVSAAFAGSDFRSLPPVTGVKGVGLGFSTNDDDVVVQNFVEGVKIDISNAAPYKTTGATNPAAANGYWFTAGTYNSQTYYVNHASTWYLWYDGVATNYITTNLGVVTYGFILQTNGTSAAVVTGNYAAKAATGLCAVAATATNVSITLATVPNSGFGAGRTLWTDTNVSANAYHPIRLLCEDSTATNLPGIYGKPFVGNERFRLIVGNAWQSNVVVIVRPVITDHP